MAHAGTLRHRGRVSVKTRKISWSKKKTPVANTLLLLSTAVILLALLECVLRLFTGESSQGAAPASVVGPAHRENTWRFHEYDSLLGWRQKARSEGVFIIPDSRTAIQINSQGLRDVEHSYKKGEKFRILSLGDSFAWGFGVEDSERYTNRLQEMLGSSFEIINAGITGYGTDQELLFFREEGRKYQPDLVLLEFGMEDEINNNSSVQYTYPKPFFSLSSDTLVLRNVPVPHRPVEWDQRWDVPGLVVSQPAGTLRVPPPVLVVSVSRWFDQHLLSYRFLHEHVVRLLPHRHSYDPLTLALLLRFNREVRACGAFLVIMVIPYKEHFHSTLAQDLRERVHVLADSAIPTIDLYQAFSDAYSDHHRFYFQQDGHWNAAGHELASVAIARFLRDRVYLNRSSLSLVAR